MKKLFTALLGVTLLVGCSDDASTDTESKKYQ